MDVPALPWFQSMQYLNPITSWENRLHSLKARFGYSQFDDPQAAIFKSTQQTRVSDYQTRLENLSRIVGLPSKSLLILFYIRSLTSHKT